MTHDEGRHSLREPMQSGEDEARDIASKVDSLHRVREAVGQRIFGHDDVIDQVLIGLMCGGHVLIEGAPGLGKTLLVRTIGEVCGLRFSRVQFTPDLMPADITGSVVLKHDAAGGARSEFEPGPVFSELVLADEINRATPKTQSALLEAMQERTVTVGGVGYPLPSPFFVLATQNPIEMEGTYVLPEAQLDRFLLKVSIPFPTEDVLDTILEHTTGAPEPEGQRHLGPEEIVELQALTRSVPIASHVRRGVVRFVLATQPDGSAAEDDVEKYVRFGVTPRGAQALILAAKARALVQGRLAVSFDDLRAMLRPALRHRFRANYEGEAKGVSTEDLLERLFDHAVASTVK